MTEALAVAAEMTASEAADFFEEEWGRELTYSERKSLTRWRAGSLINQPSTHLAAKMRADGRLQWECFMAAFPNTTEATAKSWASAYFSHPDIQQVMQRHGGEPRQLVQSLVPSAVYRAFELMHQDDDLRISMEAANSIMDRGGLPRTKEVLANLRAEWSNVAGEVLGGDFGDLEGWSNALPEPDSDDIRDAEIADSNIAEGRAVSVLPEGM